MVEVAAAGGVEGVFDGAGGDVSPAGVGEILGDGSYSRSGDGSYSRSGDGSYSRSAMVSLAGRPFRLEIDATCVTAVT